MTSLPNGSGRTQRAQSILEMEEQSDVWERELRFRREVGEGGGG